MNKVQDGFFAFADSYRPLTVSTNMRHRATVNFVENEIIIRPSRGCLLYSGDEQVEDITFTIGAAEALVTDVTAEVKASLAQAVSAEAIALRIHEDAEAASAVAAAVAKAQADGYAQARKDMAAEALAAGSSTKPGPDAEALVTNAEAVSSENAA